MSRRDLRADHLLAKNIKALLLVRRQDAGELAAHCGHKPPWISKILSLERGVPIRELGKIADFFGLTVAQLFQYGIDPLLERRHGADRRTGEERRRPSHRLSVGEWMGPADEAEWRRRHPKRLKE